MKVERLESRNEHQIYGQIANSQAIIDYTMYKKSAVEPILEYIEKEKEGQKLIIETTDNTGTKIIDRKVYSVNKKDTDDIDLRFCDVLDGSNLEDYILRNLYQENKLDEIDKYIFIKHISIDNNIKDINDTIRYSKSLIETFSGKFLCALVWYDNLENLSEEYAEGIKLLEGLDFKRLYVDDNEIYYISDRIK